MSYVPAPVNALLDFQLEYNGLLMGNGTSYYLPPDGSWAFLDMAALKTMDEARTWADGSWSGPDFADVLLPSVTLHVDAPDADAFATAVQALMAVLGPRDTPAPLWVKLPGMDPLGIPAKIHKRHLPQTNLWSFHAEGELQFRCPDPQWQGPARTLNLAASGALSSGMTFPLFVAVPKVLDFGTTGTLPNTGVLTNAGNTPAWPLVVVTGPAPGFSIVIDGNTVTYTDTVPAGQTVTIDYATGTAVLTGGVDRTIKLSSRQFSPVTSSSFVIFTASQGTAAITTADTWR